MTTTVRIQACAWPVQVTALDKVMGEKKPVRQDLGTIQPNSTGIFHAHSARELLITELPIPEQEPGPADEPSPPAEEPTE